MVIEQSNHTTATRIRHIVFGYTRDRLRSADTSLRFLDPRDIPDYTVGEVSLYVGVPESTLRTWISARMSKKRGIFPPLIDLPDPRTRMLSFYNMVEAHVLLSTREWLGASSMRQIRSALEYVKEKYPSPHPLITEKFKTDGKYLFIERIESAGSGAQSAASIGATPGGSGPINASKQGQQAFGPILEQFLSRIQTDTAGLSFKLYPIGTSNIEIDMALSSGRPVVKGRGITASALWNRREAGESIASLANDYDMDAKQIEEAIRYLDRNANAA